VAYGFCSTEEAFVDNKIETLRYRAEELRAIADEFRDQAVQQSMYRLANDYDRMAEVRERELGMKGGEQIH
jgi:hypothetical protein